MDEAEIQKSLPPLEPNTKGITKFEKYLAAAGMPDAARHVAFFRDLQTLRSAGIAHRKGDTYEKMAATFIGERTRTAVVKDLLGSASALLDALERHFLVTSSASIAGGVPREPIRSPES